MIVKHIIKPANNQSTNVQKPPKIIRVNFLKDLICRPCAHHLFYIKLQMLENLTYMMVLHKTFLIKNQNYNYYFLTQKEIELVN